MFSFDPNLVQATCHGFIVPIQQGFLCRPTGGNKIFLMMGDTWNEIVHPEFDLYCRVRLMLFLVIYIAALLARFKLDVMETLTGAEDTDWQQSIVEVSFDG